MALRQRKVYIYIYIKKTTTTPSSLPALNTDTHPGPQSLTGLQFVSPLPRCPQQTHQGQEAGGALRAFTFGIWNHSRPITNSSLLAAGQFSFSRSLSLALSRSPSSSFHQRWQQNCGPHSALINSLHEEDHQTCKTRTPDARSQ